MIAVRILCVFYAHHMSTTTTAQRGAPRKKERKHRPSIVMDKDVWKRASAMAQADGVSLSAWLEKLTRAKLEGAQ